MPHRAVNNADGEHEKPDDGSNTYNDLGLQVSGLKAPEDNDCSSKQISLLTLRIQVTVEGSHRERGRTR